ncbi:RodZ domain-containing protein [Syntrophomonas palmitatica]
MYIRAGNAGGIDIKVDGKDIPPLGKNGEVVEREFTVKK